MSFHQPAILWGLFAVLIPILIHLFNFRRIRKVYFPTLAFLQEVLKKNQRRSELKHWLVMVSRVLAVASLVLAFAGPYVPSTEEEFDLSGDRPVSIYLDNSFSMQNGNSFEGNFIKAKEDIRRLLNSLPQGTRYQLLTNDQKPGSSLFLSKDDLLDELNDLQLSPEHVDMVSMMAAQQHQMPIREREKAIYFIVSDFQDLGPLDELESDSNGQYLFLPVTTTGSTSNISIDSAWFDTPVRQLGAKNELLIKVSNFATEDLEKVSIRLFLDGTQQTAMTVDLPASGSSTVTLPLTLKKQGYQRARLEVSDYPVTFDDTYEMVWQTTKSIDIVHIHGAVSEGYIPKLLGSDSIFDVKTFRESQIDYNSFKNAKLILLENLAAISTGLQSELEEFLNAGGTILLFPPISGDLTSYNDWLQAHGAIFGDIDTTVARVDGINLNHEVFQGVFEKEPDKMDLPEVYQAYPVSLFGPMSDVILKYRVDRAFLTDLATQSGHLYICASPLSAKASSLPNHSLFAYMVLNVALQSGGHEAIAHTIKHDLSIPLGDIRFESDQVPMLKPLSGELELIPEIKRNDREVSVGFSQVLPKEGIYQLTMGDQLVRELAFNNGREESRLQIHDRSEIMEWLGAQKSITKAFVLGTDDMPLDVKLKNVREGYGLVIWFIISALFFLLIEVILLRWL